MKNILPLLFLFIVASASAQVSYDSIVRMVDRTNKIKLCGEAFKGSALREHERFTGIVREKIKDAALNIDSCDMSLTIYYEINCKGEVGNWSLSGKGNPSLKIPDKDAALIERILTVLNGITYYKTNADLPRLYSLRLSIIHHQLNVS